MTPKSEFFELFSASVGHYGGLFNAHLHLDRSSTLAQKYLAHVGMNPLEASGYPLRVKQNLTGDLHRGVAYENDDLRRRMKDNLDLMISCGTIRADSFIDVSSDNVGMRAIDCALALKDELKEKIDFRVGAYPIFGFKDSEPQRWELFVEAARKADFMGLLPERDDKQYHPNHIGFDEHFRRTLALAHELKKPVHYHVDQANDPREQGTETLIDAVRWLGSPKINEDGPAVWAVHSISPSGYGEDKFARMVDGLVKYNIGIICCPTAAISMRQLRPITTPTHNSVARVLDFLAREVPVRLGSDNVADVFLPSTTVDLTDEVHCLSNAIRFYNVDILAKLSTGKMLTDMDRELIGRFMEQDRKVFEKI